MSCLPAHGRVNCTRCFGGDAPVEFDKTRRMAGDGKWRITANPLAWGSEAPEIVVLGFSKGPTQAGALATAPHDQIAYKGSRTAAGKILAHLGVLPRPAEGGLGKAMDRLISDQQGAFHFGSLVRCTVERHEEGKGGWTGSGGGMLDKFVATPFGQEVAGNCAAAFLADLPPRTRLVILFGLGTKLNYVREARRLISSVRPGDWRDINEVAYTDGKVTFVHVEHFAAQGALIPNWLGETGNARSILGLRAREAVQHALAS